MTTALETSSLKLLRRIEKRLREQAAWPGRDQRLHADINALIHGLEQAAAAPAQPAPRLKPVAHAPPPAPLSTSPQPAAAAKTKRRKYKVDREKMLPVWRANAVKARAARLAKLADERARTAAAAELPKNIIIRTVVKEVPVHVPIRTPIQNVELATVIRDDQPDIDPKFMGRLHWGKQGQVISTRRERERARMSAAEPKQVGSLGAALREAADCQLKQGLAQLKNSMRTQHWVKVGLGDDGRPVCRVVPAAEQPTEEGYTFSGPFGTPAEAEAKGKQLLHDAYRYS